MKFHLALIAAAVSAATNLPLPASAQAPTRVVRFDDLNLASAQGRAVFDRRVQAAIVDVCGDPGSQDLQLSIIQKTCQRKARAAADAQMLAIGRPDRVLAVVGGRDN